MSENEGAGAAPDAEESASPDAEGGVEPTDTAEDAEPSERAEHRSPGADGQKSSDAGSESRPDDDAAAPDDAVEPERTAEGSTDELVERVDEADAEQLAGEIAALRDRVETLERELADREDRVDDLESKLKRKQADFQNFKKRQERKREAERQRATEDLVERLIDVRDNLVRALEQDESSDIRGGVETTLRQFDRVLDAEEVRTIDPEAGAPVDPGRHEVLLCVESDQEAGTVADIHRPGYEMAGKVLRPAQVTVAEDEEE